MSTTDYQTPGMRDPEFHGPEPKRSAFEAERPRSGLAVTSLVFGILAWTVLPVVGALIAIVTGHLGLSEIRAEGDRLSGRPQAKAGLALGYLQLLIAALVAVVAGWLLAVWTGSASAPVGVTSVATTRHASEPQPGVRMLNEMTRRDFKAVEDLNLPQPDEVVIGLFEGEPPAEPERAILTDRRIIYVKGDRVTELPLKEVESVIDSNEYQQKYTPNYFGSSHFMIEVKGKSGARMRIAITPNHDGPFFYQAIKDAWTAEAGGGKKEVEPVR